MYILDTNVISELRRQKPHGAVLAWFDAVKASEIFVPAVVFSELQAGLGLTRKHDAAKAREIEIWVNDIEETAACLQLTSSIARETARLLADVPNAEYEDASIAATALICRMTVVTRNIRDFRNFPVPLINPFEFRSSPP